MHTVSTDIKSDVKHAVKEVEQQKEVVLTRSPKLKKKNGKGKRIEVKDGDTLYGIARKHNVCFLLHLSSRTSSNVCILFRAAQPHPLNPIFSLSITNSLITSWSFVFENTK